MKTAIQETGAHLELLDGLLEDLLERKWQAYGRKRFFEFPAFSIQRNFSWFKSLLMFVVYFAVVLASFMLRPFSETTRVR